MAIPLPVGVAAGVTGFVEKGLQKMSDKQKTDADLEKSKLTHENRLKELDKQYTLMDLNAKRKAAYDNAVFNRSLLGVQYNVAQIPEKQQSGYALNTLIANVDQAKTFLNSTREENPQAFRNALSEFNRIFTLEYNAMAKASGTIEGGASEPSMRMLDGLAKLKDIPEIHKILTNTSRYFNRTLNQVNNNKDEEKRAALLRGGAGTNNTGDTPESLVVALKDTKTPQLTPKIITDAKDRVVFAGKNVGMRDINQPVHAIMAKRELDSADEAALGVHYLAKIERVQTDDGSSAAHQTRLLASASLFDSHRAQTSHTQIDTPRPALRDVVGQDTARQDAWNAEKKTALVRNYIEGRQQIYKTSAQVTTILRDIKDLLVDPSTAVGIGGDLLLLGNGLVAQGRQFLKWYQSGMQAGASPNYFANISMTTSVAKKLAENIKIYETEKAKLGKKGFSAANTQLLASLSYIAGFYLARISQEDDTKISDYDVKSHVKALGVHNWFIDKKAAVSAVNYFIKQSTDKMVKLQGFAKDINSARDYEAAKSWDRIMTRGMQYDGSGQRKVSATVAYREEVAKRAKVEADVRQGRWVGTPIDNLTIDENTHATLVHKAMLKVPDIRDHLAGYIEDSKNKNVPADQKRKQLYFNTPINAENKVEWMSAQTNMYRNIKAEAGHSDVTKFNVVKIPIIKRSDDGTSEESIDIFAITEVVMENNGENSIKIVEAATDIKALGLSGIRSATKVNIPPRQSGQPVPQPTTVRNKLQNIVKRGPGVYTKKPSAEDRVAEVDARTRIVEIDKQIDELNNKFYKDASVLKAIAEYEAERKKLVEQLGVK